MYPAWNVTGVQLYLPGIFWMKGALPVEAFESIGVVSARIPLIRENTPIAPWNSTVIW